MEIIQIQVNRIQAPPWNPNVMDDGMAARLSRSIQVFGFLVPLVVRAVDDGLYETVGGAQRLEVMKALGHEEVPCIVVTADHAQARLHQRDFRWLDVVAAIRKASTRLLQANGRWCVFAQIDGRPVRVVYTQRRDHVINVVTVLEEK